MYIPVVVRHLLARSRPAAGTGRVEAVLVVVVVVGHAFLLQLPFLLELPLEPHLRLLRVLLPHLLCLILLLLPRGLVLIRLRRRQCPVPTPENVAADSDQPLLVIV